MAYALCPNDGAGLVAMAGDPLIGSIIADRYLIEEALGEGSMGMVYRARHVRLSRQFAVKILFGDLAADATMRLRFASEAEAACRLAHPNVVSVVDFGLDTGGVLYLAMNYVDGECLRDLLHREAPLLPARALDIAAQIADGLSHAHENGIIHRDLKPENVIIERVGRREVPHVLDFGLAISTDEELQGVRLTGGGVMLGTPSYMSPEQIEQRSLDGRSDLFGLGVITYEMLCRETPFDGSSLEIVSQICSRPAPALAARNPAASVPGWLEAVIFRLLAREPGHRFRSAAEASAVLRAAARALEGEDGGVTLDEFLAGHIEPDTGEVAIAPCAEGEAEDDDLAPAEGLAPATEDDDLVPVTDLAPAMEDDDLATEDSAEIKVTWCRHRHRRALAPVRVVLWMAAAVTFVFATAQVAESLALGAPRQPSRAWASEPVVRAHYPAHRQSTQQRLVPPH